LPSLENLHQHFKDKPFALLAIDVGEKKDIVREFVRDKGLSFTFLLDEDGQVTSQYGVRAHPTKFLLDNKGNLLGVAKGYGEWDSDEMKALIRLLMS
jgi:peroxiredoxin